MTTAHESLGPARKSMVPSLSGCKKIKHDRAKHIRNCGHVKLQVKDQLVCLRDHQKRVVHLVLADSSAQIQIKHGLQRQHTAAESTADGKKKQKNRIESAVEMDLVLLETTEEDNEDAAESEQDEEDADANADPDVVGTCIGALNAMGADPDEDDLNFDDQCYFDRMGENDGPLDDDDDDGIDVDDEEPADHPPEKRTDPMEPFPDYSIPNDAQENGEYLSSKR
jgi:hypothetical protein